MGCPLAIGRHLGAVQVLLDLGGIDQGIPTSAFGASIFTLLMASKPLVIGEPPCSIVPL